MSAVFELYNLQKKHGDKIVVSIDRCCFDQGRIYCLYGTNGSGKTTLFELLTLLQKPDSGEIVYKGRRIYPGDDGLDLLRSEVTLVHQSPLLFDTTVEKNVAYGLSIRSVPKAQRNTRVAECLSIVGLSGFEKRRAHALSGGEVQRVAIARALAVKPAVILLDEFSANVDSDNRLILERIIRDISRESTTTVMFTTHYLDQAYRLAHEVLHLYEGRLVDPCIRNIFKGTIGETADGRVFHNDVLRLFVSCGMSGPAAISVPSDCITLSRHPLDSSMRNCLQGNICQIADNGSSIIVKVDAGAMFEVTITRQSFFEMQLGPGSGVYVYFKSTSVKVM